MKPHAGYTLPILVIVINMGTPSNQRATNDGGSDPYKHYNDKKEDYNYNYGEYSNNDYKSNYGDYAKPPEPLLCYSCYYHVHEGGNHVGNVNCNDPFNVFDIPTVACPADSKCGKVYRRISDTEFIISRNCMNACEASESDTMRTECCTTKLCNGGKGSTIRVHIILLVSCALSTWLLNIR